MGDRGPQAMPGNLPPLSGYTYASQFTIDEAKGGAVAFNKPVVAYLDNFLGFPVGTTIPAGAYEANRGASSAGESGKVVEVVAAGAGLGLDTTGDGIPDQGNPDEMLELGKVAKVGDRFWRVPLRHFSPWDLNLGFSPRKRRAAAASGHQGRRERHRAAADVPGRLVVRVREPSARRETLPIVGTGLSLTYRSNRVRGQSSAYTVRVPSSAPACRPRSRGPSSRSPSSWADSSCRCTRAASRRTSSMCSCGTAKTRRGSSVAGQAIALVTVGYASEGVYEDSPLFGFASSSIPPPLDGQDAHRDHPLARQLRSRRSLGPSWPRVWRLEPRSAPRLRRRLGRALSR